MPCRFVLLLTCTICLGLAQWTGLGVSAIGMPPQATKAQNTAAVAQADSMTLSRNPSAETAQPIDRFWQGVAASGLVGIGGLLLWRLVRGATSRRSSAPVQPAFPEASAADLLPDQDGNGHLAAIVLESEGGDRQEPEPHLAKINIGEELIRDLYSSDPVQRRRAIWELGQRGDSQAVQPLVDLMLDSDSQQRSLILAAVSEIGVRTLKPMHRALLISLQDESAEVRKNAIRDLTRICDLVAQVSQLVSYALDDSDAEVRETARWALGQLNRIRAKGDPPESSPDRLPPDLAIEQSQQSSSS